MVIPYDGPSRYHLHIRNRPQGRSFSEMSYLIVLIKKCFQNNLSEQKNPFWQKTPYISLFLFRHASPKYIFRNFSCYTIVCYKSMSDHVTALHLMLLYQTNYLTNYIDRPLLEYHSVMHLSFLHFTVLFNVMDSTIFSRNAARTNFMPIIVIS